MSSDFTQEEVNAFLKMCSCAEEAVMPVLKTCVVIGDKLYCYDEARKKCVAVKLEVQPDVPVPEKAEKLIAMKRFNLIEPIYAED